MATTGCDAKMQRQLPAGSRDLDNLTVVVTRPAGTAVSMARKIRARGGLPLLLPGLSLRPVLDPAATQSALHKGLAADVLIFSSPAAVRFAAALSPLKTAAMVLAVGQETARALHRHGIRRPMVPARQDSEGLLEHFALGDVQGRRVVLIGAAGGRGLLRDTLLARGAELHELHVYQRVSPRLDRRHVEAVRALPASACVLLSSAEALNHLCRLLPRDALARLQQATAIVSSARLAAAARAAGFMRITEAASALSADMLDAAAHRR